MTETGNTVYFEGAPATQPMDSAFVRREVFSEVPDTEVFTISESAAAEKMVTDIIIVICAISFLLSIKKFINLLPSLIGCILRWKEAVNLEFSMKLKRDRNILTFIMIAPFCLLCWNYRLYDPDFMEGFSELVRLGITAGVFAAMLVVRFIAEWCFKGWKCDNETYKIGICSSRTFFIIYTHAALAAALITSIVGLSKEVSAIVVLTVILGFYALSLLRKTQIFANSCNLFQAFLYLCGLEILPTSLVIVSALIL